MVKISLIDLSELPHFLTAARMKYDFLAYEIREEERECTYIYIIYYMQESTSTFLPTAELKSCVMCNCYVCMIVIGNEWAGWYQ